MATEKRRLIYVDASGTNNQYQLSIYDSERKIGTTLLLKNVDNINDGEQYAIYYAFLYIKRNGYDKCYILCDNKNAVDSITTERLSKDYKVGVSWIPREANIIADKLSKKEAKTKVIEENTLDLFVDLIMKQCFKDNITLGDNNLKNKSLELEETIKIKNTKINNQKNQINMLMKNIEELKIENKELNR